MTIDIKNETIDQAKEFRYLASLIAKDNESMEGIKRRITTAKQAFETNN